MDIAWVCEFETAPRQYLPNRLFLQIRRTDIYEACII